MLLNEIRIIYMSVMYKWHLAIRYLHDKTYQKGGWYKKWNDKSYSSAVHRATLTAFTISFMIFTVLQGLFPMLFNPVAPSKAFAGANSKTWTSSQDFVAGISENLVVGDSLSLYGEAPADNNYGFERATDYGETGVVNVMKVGDAIYSGLSNGNIAKRDPDTMSPVVSFGTSGTFSSGLGSIIDLEIDNTAGYLYFLSNTSPTWSFGKISLATGALDTNFGGTGIITTDPSPGTDTPYGLTLDANYVYIAGSDSVFGDSGWHIEKRLKSTGDYDYSFGGGGYISSNPSAGSDSARAIETDGTYMYLAGVDFTPGNNEWRLEKRLLSSGELDSNFGTAGVISINHGAGSDLITVDAGLLFKSDYLYITGVDSSSGNTQWRVEKRSGISGALEPSFGINGVYINNVSVGSDSAIGLDISSDGYLFIGGYDSANTNQGWRVEKIYSSNAAPATEFGSSGVYSTNPSSSTDRVNAVRTIDNKLYLGGYKSGSVGAYEFRSAQTAGTYVGGLSSNPSIGVDRYYDVVTTGDFFYGVGSYNTGAWLIEKRSVATGALDTGFGTDGQIIEDFSVNTDIPYSVTTDGNFLYVAGYDGVNGSLNTQWRVMQYSLSAGTPGWIFVSNPGTSNDIAYAIDYSDGLLYIAGTQSVATNNTQWRVEAISATDASYVTGFGTSGAITNNPGTTNDTAQTILVDGEYIFVAGMDTTIASNNSQWRIEKRLKSDGSLVAGFGTGGTITINPGGTSTSTTESIYALLVVNGSLYMGGGGAMEGISGTQWRLEKRNAITGSLDTGFGVGGAVEENGAFSLEVIYSLVTDGASLFLGGAYADTDGSGGFRLEKRSLADGSFVEGFGTNGFLQLGPTSSGDYARGLALNGNDLILVGYAGSYVGATNVALHIEKYSKNYSDGSYGGGGFISPGTLTGLKINAGDGIKPWWKSISANQDLPAGTTISYYVRTANVEADLLTAPWTAVALGPLALSTSQWLELKVELATTDNLVTPTVSDITLEYETLTVNPADFTVTLNDVELPPEAYVGDTSIMVGLNNLPCLSDLGTCRVEVERVSTDTVFDGITPHLSSSFASGSTVRVTISAGLKPGPQKVRIRMRDDLGRMGPWTDYNDGQISWTVDAKNPNGTVAIENDATYTSGTQVHLNLGATDSGGSSLAQMRFSNDSANWTDWEPYSNEPKLWTLSGGTGQKNVFVQYKDGAGNISGVSWPTVGDLQNNVSTTGEAVTANGLTIAGRTSVSSEPEYFGKITAGNDVGSIEGTADGVGLRFAAIGKQHWASLGYSLRTIPGYAKFALRTSDDGITWGPYLGRDGQKINWDSNYFGKNGEMGEDYTDLTNIPDSKYIDIAVLATQVEQIQSINIESAAVASIELDSVLPETDFVATNKYPNESWSIREFSNNAELRFATNKKTLAYVDYGIESVTESSAGDPIFATDHSVILRPLKSNTDYKYRIRLIDEKNNMVQYPETGYYSLKTLGVDAGFDGGPLVSDLSQVDITASKVKITWKTKNPSSSYVDFGFDTSYGQVAGDDILTSEHLIELDNVTAGQTYHYRVRSIDANGNEYVSGDYTFKALVKPEISEILVTNITANTAEVSWKTNVKTNSVINYSIGLPYNRREQKDELITNHSVSLQALDDGTVFNFQIEAQDDAGNITKTENRTFTTRPDTTGPKISNVRVDVIPLENEKSNSQVIISWTTDEPATALVEYGQGLVGGSYTNSSVENTSLNLTHVVILKDLQTASTYHYRVSSKDKRSNLTVSLDYNFITPARNKSIWQIVLRALEETFSWTRDVGIFWINVGNRFAGKSVN